MFRATCLLTTITMLPLLTGCIGYQHSVETSGLVPGAELLENIGTTLTTEDLSDTLGAPSSVGRDASGAQLWVYDAKSTHQHRARLLPLFAVNIYKAAEVRHVFEVKAGEVTRHWIEER